MKQVRKATRNVVQRSVIGLLGAGFIATIGAFSSNYFSTLESPIEKENYKQIAMYVEGDLGEYEISSSKVFPTTGYVLNLEKSSCKNGGILSQDPTTKVLSLLTSSQDSCTVYFDKEKKIGTEDLLDKINGPEVTTYEAGNKGEMFTFAHEATKQTSALTDYRYIGENPNNYVTFNDEIWRIIGVFETENSVGTMEQRIKIVRQEAFKDLKWNTKSLNEWSAASLQTLLNNDYYNKTGSYASTGLSEEARSMIDMAKWYLGEVDTGNNKNGPFYYNSERGTPVYSGHSSNIIQNVGLIYPSDYAYTYANGVNEKCYTDTGNCSSGIPTAGWMYSIFGKIEQWTSSPLSSSSMERVLTISTSGGVSFYSVTNPIGVQPVVYLKSSVKLVDGDGTQGNPYVFAI